jgi:adenylate cyclase
MSGLSGYRRDLAVLDNSSGRIPQIQHNPPTASSQIAPWMSSSPTLPSSAFPTSFYNDSSDNLSQTSQLSPGFRPSTGRTGNFSADSHDQGYFHDGDERRPSIASVTTASSSGSKSSSARPGGVQKNLKAFFGEDFTGKDGSDTNLPGHPNGKEQRSGSWSRHRNHSITAETSQRDASPVPSRPRTPVPSSDVVPFLYQDSEVSPYPRLQSSCYISIRGHGATGKYPSPY